MNVFLSKIKKNLEKIIQEVRKRRLAILVGWVFALSILLILSLTLNLTGAFQKEKILKNKAEKAEKSEIFSDQGKTWVAFDEPIVKVKVLTVNGCDLCNPEETLVGLKRLVPTIMAEKIDADSVAGKALAEEMHIMSVPTFIFSSSLENTNFFAQAKSLFISRGGAYILENSQLEIPIGKFLRLPSADDRDTVIGPKEAKITIAEFADFQCPFCKVSHQTVKKALSDYEGKIRYVYKHFPITPVHPRSIVASEASECAYEQGKFMNYADVLFANQASWGASKTNDIFVTYAKNLKMDVQRFSDCLEQGKYREKVLADEQEGKYFNLPGTPSLFVNDQLLTGVVNATTLKKVIDPLLNQ